MSVIDKALAAITPAPSAEKRAEATAAAREVAAPGDWLSAALDHHEAIRAAFQSGREAAAGEERLAEELVLYPAMARHGHKGQAGLAYGEQTAAKMQMAELETIAPDSQAWLDKWEHVEGAVLTHMYEEEHGWFLHLKAHAEDQDRLKIRYLQEFDRYVGG